MYSPEMTVAGVKRARECEQDEDEYQEQTESKRMRGLPFRSEPNSQFPAPSFSSRSRIVRPQTLTPVDSSEDESDSDQAKGIGRPSLSLDLVDEDMDMDMDMEEPQDQPLWSALPPESAIGSTFPSSSRLTINTPRFANTQTPRIPTPIYGHFSAPIYPANMPPPSPMMPPPSYINQYPRIKETDPWRRALPSPISEDETMESSVVETEEMISKFKMSASTPPVEPSFSSQETLTPDTPSSRGGWSVENSPRNRRRSGAVGDSSKMTFAMGFRADCEKCRDRVPGHYGHIIRSGFGGLEE